MLKNIKKLGIIIFIIGSLTACSVKDVELTSYGEQIKNICEKEPIKGQIKDSNIHTIFNNYVNKPEVKEKLKQYNITTDKKNFRTDNSTYNWIGELFKQYIKNQIENGNINTLTLSIINSQLFELDYPQITFGIPKDISQLTEEQYDIIINSYFKLIDLYIVDKIDFDKFDLEKELVALLK